MKKALFLHFFKVSTDRLQVFDNCESGKWIKLLFWKKSGKSLEFFIQKSVQTLKVQVP